jgi:ribonucleoside-diphosphate reductase alpha chain
MDNGLENGGEVNETALDLFLSGEISEKAAQELGVVIEGESAECPKDDCDGTLQPTDDCSMCDECYYSPCN